jgi:hypothetical protein
MLAKRNLGTRRQGTETSSKTYCRPAHFPSQIPAATGIATKGLPQKAKESLKRRQ